MLLQEVGVNTNQLKLKHYFAWPCILPTKRPADHWSTLSCATVSAQASSESEVRQREPSSSASRRKSKKSLGLRIRGGQLLLVGGLEHGFYFAICWE